MLLHYCQLTLGLLEICTSTERSIGPTLHPVQALKNHRLIRGSTILDHIGTHFLGGRPICSSDLYASIYGNFNVYIEHQEFYKAKIHYISFPAASP